MNTRRYKEGRSRQQAMLMPPSIDEYIDANNPVRAIDLYVESLDLKVLGFKHVGGSCTAGQPAYRPGMLLKLYLWGYLNKTRSSRMLERETYRNLEVIWLLQDLHPTYKSIADFRKNNSHALKATNRDFTLLCRELALFGTELVAIDSTFMEGNASKASMHTHNKVTRQLAKIEEEIDRWHAVLDEQDAQESPSSAVPATDAISAKLAQLKQRQQRCEHRLHRIKAQGGDQISETDPDARLLNKKTDKGPTAGYNVQIAVDQKHKLIVAHDVVNDRNDQQQLAPVATMAKAMLKADRLTVAADGGYYNQDALKDCEDHGITAYVPIPKNQGLEAKPGRYRKQDFQYNDTEDAYTCPAGKVLHRSGDRERNGKRMQRYVSRVQDCRHCPLRSQCLTDKARHRHLERWEHEAVNERHQQRMDREGAVYMKLRAGLAEHPFGTLKVRAGWTHFLSRGFDNVRAECSLMVLCYNFTRLLNIDGAAERFKAHCIARQSGLNRLIVELCAALLSLGLLMQVQQ
tara:strand:- start:5 stop:1555 length:1551 start_codon:yes stop_codon:yes gene_type:complete